MPERTRGPHVVIIGGYLTIPPFYWPLRQRLLERGAERVVIAPVYWPDWLAIAVSGFGPVMLRGGRAIRETRRDAPGPIIVVGHSAGGIVARLAMSFKPYDGRQADVAGDVGCLVTLGTPHRLRGSIGRWHHPGLDATEYLEAVTPGAWYAPMTSYLTVGSTFVEQGGPVPTNPFKRIVDLIFGAIVGQTPGARGDGIVSDDLSRLEGARHLSLERALHGTFGAPWYGDAHLVDEWWPVALQAWREAVAARDPAAPRPASGAGA